MAFFDDRRFLLSHIRHSFITCDDTGMCEMVMLNETMPHHLADEPNAEILDNIQVQVKSELVDAAQSYDIVSDMEMIGAHRRRSNTAQRLERLKKERKSQAKVKVIHWKDSQHSLTESELQQLFPRKELPKKQEEKVIKKSALSAQIKKYPSVPSNPFNEYARFDGRVSEGAPTKRILIFLMMLPVEERIFPMEVVTLCSARVQDLIGLICWLYTNENREPKLRPTVADYCLRIAEETGEIEPDFPNLDPKEPVAKFGFPVLALVEKGDNKKSLLVTVHIGDVFSKVQAPHSQVTLNWILEQILKKRKADLLKKYDYNFEKLEEPGKYLDMNLKLIDADEREFRLIIEEVNDEESEEESALPDMSAVEAPLYKSFVVSAVHKGPLGRNAEVQLGISGKKVEIAPVLNKSSKIWSWQPKAAAYDVENIAECELVAQKSSTGKATFKLVFHTGSEFQSQRFEAESKVVNEIVKKLQYIMQMRSSSVRDEYAVLKEQRLQRKASHPHILGFS